MRKITSIILALVIIMSLSFTVFAATDTTITVTDDRTYEVYQIFTGDLSGSTLSNIKWGQNGTGTVGAAVDKAILTELEAVRSSSDAAKLAVIEKYFKADSTAIGTASKAAALTVKTGYYLLKDTTTVTAGQERSIFIVEIVGPTTIKAKAGEVEATKKVKDNNDSTGTTSDWQDAASYDIGDDVPFKLTGNVSANYAGYDSYYYCFHDKLSEGLSFNNDVAVYVDGIKITDGYEVITTCTDGCTFEVKFNDLKEISSVKANSKITVEYTAKLTGDDVVIGSTGNPNDMHLEYSNDPNSNGKGNTAEDKVIVFTYKVVVNKIDGDSKAALTGAGFTLYKYDASVEGEDKWVAVGEEIKGEDITTFAWTGLDDGNYKLVETTTPPGYNTMADITFTISSTYGKNSADPKLTVLDGGTLGTGNVATGTITKDIENNKGTILPETGAKGTMMFIVFGSVIAMIAVVLMVTRKKMSIYED